MNLKTPPLKDQLQREVSDKGRKQKQRKKEKKTQKLGPGPNFTTRSSTGHPLSIRKSSVHLEQIFTSFRQFQIHQSTLGDP